MKKMVIGGWWLVIGGWCLGAMAEPVRFARVFGDNMVLQADRPIPVWGVGEPGEKVTVSFNGASAAATVDAKGEWSTTLAAQKPCAEGKVLEAKVEGEQGKDFSLKNVRVGDVYFVMGDRHVGWPFWTVGADIKTDFDRYADTNLCWFISPIQGRASYPVKDLEPPNPHYGYWRSCREKDRLGSFPYFWAREKAEKSKMPVGVIVVTGGAYDRCDARMFMRPEAYAATTNDQKRPLAYDEQNPTSAKGLAKLQAAAAEIGKWAREARALPQGKYPASNMAQMPNMERYGQVTTWYNYQMAPFLKTPIKGAVFYAGCGWGPDPKEAPLAQELKADMRRLWGKDLEFTIVPVPEKTVMTGDCPSECNKPREVIRALDPSNK